MYYSAVASMLLGTILATQISEKKPRMLFLIGIAIIVLFANYFERVIPYIADNTSFQLIFSKLQDSSEGDILPSIEGISFLTIDSVLQCLIVSIFIVIINIIKWEKYVLNPDKMVKKIINIMDKGGDKEVVEMLAGDMDFLGQVSFGQKKNKRKVVAYIKNKNLDKDDRNRYILSQPVKDMDENNEYLQLKNLCNNTKLKLKILCKYDLNIEVETTSFENLFDTNLQQMLRIAKIKRECPRVEIKFYNEHSEDFGTRARFITYSANIPMKALTYVETDSEKATYYLNLNKNKDKILINKIGCNVAKILGRMSKNIITYQVDSSRWKYSESAKNDVVKPVYQDYFSSKWDKIDVESSNIIVERCLGIYDKVAECIKENKKNAVNDDDKDFSSQLNIRLKYKFVLIYISSYEVAHFKEYRKEFPPFGILYLASIIRDAGWDVEIKSISENAFTHDLSDADVVGLSMVSSYGHAIFKKFVDTSKFKRGRYMVAGGYHAEKYYQDMMRDMYVDLVFSGEGENALTEFLNKYFGAKCPKTYINGTFMIDKESQSKSEGASPLKMSLYKFKESKDTVKLDSIPFPARDLLPESDIVMTGRLRNDSNVRIVHVLFSRGCSKMCLYCGATKDGKNSPVRYRSPDNIVEELILLKKTYKIDGFAIIDDCFLTDKNAAIKICKAIENASLNLKWSLAARADQIDLDILGSLKDAGCVEIKFGIESGSNIILNYMNKGCSSTCAENAINLAHEQGFYVKCFIVSGFPGETAVTTKETLLFLKKLHKKIDSVSLLRFTPLPGSPIFSNPEKYGIDKEKLILENFDNLHLYHGNFNWWKDETEFKKKNTYYKVLEQYIERIWKNDKVIY